MNEEDNKINVRVGSSQPLAAGTEIKPSISSAQNEVIEPTSSLGATNQADDSYTKASIPVSPAPADATSSPLGTISGSGAGDAGNNKPGPVIGGGPTPDKPKSKLASLSKKSLIIVAAVGLLLIGGGSAGAYYGYVQPNKPENVWNKAISNTGKGYEKLIEYADQNKDKKTTKVEGDYELSFNGLSADGSFGSESTETKSKTNFDVGVMGSRVKIDLLAEAKESSQYPDIYLKAEGIQPFLDAYAQTQPEATQPLGSLDNQWIHIDKSFYEQSLGAQLGAEISDGGFNQEDVYSLANIVGDKTKTYVLTDDPSQSVLDASEFIGKENVDGRTQFHYKVGVNKDNLKKYLGEVTKEIESSEAFKKLVPDNTDPVNIEELNSSIDEADLSYKADVWVDAKTKLVRSVRFAEKGSEGNYLEVGLKYDGGDNFPFYIKFVNEDKGDGAKADVNLMATLNTKENNVVLKADAKLEGEASGSFTLNGKVNFSNDEVNIDIPADSISIMEALNIDPNVFQNPYTINEEDALLNIEQDINTLGVSTDSSNQIQQRARDTLLYFTTL